MSIFLFEQVETKEKTVGGKAWGLARLAQAGFPVPRGLVLSAPPDENDMKRLLAWWAERGSPPLAVRSSATAEDSAETSFAGQNRSFLKVSSESGLREAIVSCFASGGSESSLAYRRHFTGDERAGRMNVVVQEMVDARFAGVYFSQDPRTGGPWILEVIRGLGEDLVSGKVDPGRFSADGSSVGLPQGFTAAEARVVADTGERVATALGFPVDMEWAIDREGRFHVLQARPITTRASSSGEFDLSRELERLRASHPARTTWDGQTFAEWNGAPSPFTFALWREAFSPRHAFGDALRDLGYVGFDERSFPPGDSLLEDVFGRAYVNLDRMTDLYYGPIPYTIEARPRPHTRFDRRKISAGVIAHMPAAIWSMMKVSWNVSSRRRSWLRKSADQLSAQKNRLARPQSPSAFTGLPFVAVRELLLEECESFSRDVLHWPLLLVVLTESTIQSLRLILAGVVGEAEVDRTLREWMAAGLHTVTRDMMDEMREATLDSKRRPTFLARYGHRGPGEMDLMRPRWSELGEGAFRGKGFKATASTLDVEAVIGALKTFKRDIILEEWRLFKALLEQREQWKMELLKPYAQIRYLLEEVGRRTGLGDDVHWLEPVDVASLSEDGGGEKIRALIDRRKARHQAFRSVALPEILDLDSLAAAVAGSPSAETRGLSGEPLSPGIAFGEIRYVEDPSRVDLDQWPDGVILAAPATDPGWTELFLRSKGIIVERGGVLSHCAIVARELSIPAVSGILGLRELFHDGDRVWVDGNTGRIRREGGPS